MIDWSLFVLRPAPIQWLHLLPDGNERESQLMHSVVSAEDVEDVVVNVVVEEAIVPTPLQKSRVKLPRLLFNHNHHNLPHNQHFRQW